MSGQAPSLRAQVRAVEAELVFLRHAVARYEAGLRQVKETPTLPHWCSDCKEESYCYGPDDVPAWDAASTALDDVAALRATAKL